MCYLEKILPYNLDQTRLQKRGEWHLPRLSFFLCRDCGA